MKVLKATEIQYQSLNSRVNRNSLLQLTKDANDNWIIGKDVLNDINWQAIKPDLLQLEEIDFNPIVTEL